MFSGERIWDTSRVGTKRELIIGIGTKKELMGTWILSVLGTRLRESLSSNGLTWRGKGALVGVRGRREACCGLPAGVEVAAGCLVVCVCCAGWRLWWRVGQLAGVRKRGGSLGPRTLAKVEEEST